MRNVLRVLILFVIAYVIVLAPLFEHLADFKGPPLQRILYTAYTVSPVASWLFAGLFAGALFWPSSRGHLFADRLLFGYIGWFVFAAAAAQCTTGDPFAEFDRPFKLIATCAPWLYAPCGAAVGRLLLAASQEKENV